jgi:rhamnogalacturonyl hydrolase YesR
MVTGDGELRAENYLSLSKDGAWCWFSDPRALYFKGRYERLYAGWTTSTGDVVIGSYNYRTKKITSKIIYPDFQQDDHTVPSLLFLPDGRLMTFFTRHNGTLYYAAAEKPEDIESFSKVDSLDLGNRLCYTNPVMLSEENNRIYLFSRGGYDWKPSFIYSDDLGKTWSKPQVFIAKPGASKSNRPYVKIAGDGKSAIHFAFTDGHPRIEACNSIYYLKYKKGAFYDASGNKIGTMKNLPLNQNTVPKVYDGRKTEIRAWVWDTAFDNKGNPVIVYAALPEESKHYYNYARWDGKKWQNERLCAGGGWFPREYRPKEKREREPHYSGGIVLNHRNPDIVYLSKPYNDVYEIERWQRNAENGKWAHEMITSQSEHDNVRPFAVRNLPADKKPALLWMMNKYYHHYSDYFSEIKADVSADAFSADFKKADVYNIMRAAADWQIENFPEVKHHWLSWPNGALYVGMMRWAKMADTNKYLSWLEGIGKKYYWQPYCKMYHADDVVVLQSFLELYRLKKNEKMLMPAKARLDWVIANPSPGSLDLRHKDEHSFERWSWCDALFMAPPVYLKLSLISGNDKYMQFMDKEYKATYDFLFDKEEHLFYRDSRYFDKREANGEKIFWGRGNGWVIAGLANMLRELPQNSKYRPFYESLYKEMAARIAGLQDESGAWHASLLDPQSYPNPEMSSSGFFCYALAYGINSGLLDKEKYLPKVRKAWTALVKSVYPDGKLGWVQPIGADPKKVTRNMTEVYGVGAFLLAGSEIIKLSK